MILIEDAKYSCLECIRGHRSSQCRHYSKPLLQVRSKGRPNFQINGNPNHRIAVFAEEFVTKEDEEEALSKKNMNAKNKPVIILKASSKHVFDLKNGQVVGEYDENEHNKGEDFASSAPLIKSDSFVNSSCCCSQGITKPRKSCGCKSRSATGSSSKRKIDSNNIKRNIDILKEQYNLTDCQKTNLFDEVTLQNLGNSDWINALCNSKDTEKTADTSFFTKENRFSDCSVLGICMCDDNCGCEDCIVHNNHINGDLKDMYCREDRANGDRCSKVKEEFISQMGVGNDSGQNEILDLGTAINHRNKQTAGFNHWSHSINDNRDNESTFYCDIVKVPLCTIPGSCVCDDSCTCEGCTVHGNAAGNQDLRKDSLKVSQDEKLMDSIDRFNIPWELHPKGYTINSNDNNVEFLDEVNHEKKNIGHEFSYDDINSESFKNVDSMKEMLNVDPYLSDKSASEVRKDHSFESFQTDIDACNSTHCSQNGASTTSTLFNFSDPKI